MIDLGAFVRGALLGFAIAAPVGPIGVLCIKRSLNEGWRIGFISGLGAATADMFYGAVAVLGLTVIASFLVGISTPLRLFGGAFLLYLGVKTLLSKPAHESAKVVASRNAWGAYLSTLMLTLTNPLTILSFTGLFAGLTAPNELLVSLLLVLGVFTGSAAWWFLLSGVVGYLLHGRLDWGVLVWVNRLSGVVILIFAVVILFELFSN
ncbi:MAG: LysE family transporter [Anaerolineae bacterium]